MNRHSVASKTKVLRALGLGLALTLVQIFVAVLLIAPPGQGMDRYRTLVQHDSYWFANIIDRGYNTILPPIQHKLMEVSNVAFFPAYPTLAAAVSRLTGLSTRESLLVTAQLSTCGFWTYFFLLSDRWKVTSLLQVIGALAILSHPVSFFLVAAYSESLFLMALLGFIYWTGAEGRAAAVLAGLHGFVMSATRIVGLPCAAYPVVRRLFLGGWEKLRAVRTWLRQYAGPVAIMFFAMLGGLSFFGYCLLRWGHWDLYMLTQKAGWDVQADYLAVFKPANYHWFLPSLRNPTAWSQVTTTAGAALFFLCALAEWLPAFRLRTRWQARAGLYFVAWILFYIAVSGVASVQMESMMRYQFCAYALIVLALMHFSTQLPAPSPVWRALGLGVFALLCAAGLSLQGWWVWNFTRGNWVA